MINNQNSQKKNFIFLTIIFLTFLFIFMLIPNDIEPYFWGYPSFSLGPFWSGSNHIYGVTGISGLPMSTFVGGLNSGLSNLGILGGIGRSYGLYGGLYAGLYGGLYGANLYGGLYGGLYGSGLYGSGLYGGLYGATNLYNSGLLGFTGLYGGFGSSSLTNPIFVAQQVGTWTGTWTNFVNNGLMTLNLAEDPLTGALYGFAQLLGNTYLSALIDVDGTVLNSQIFVSGSGVGLGNQNFTCEIIGILTSATTMTGTYNMINNSSGGNLVEQGAISLTLITPVI